jgi:hypothetical protein
MTPANIHRIATKVGFADVVRKIVLARIAVLSSGGTVGVSQDCLWNLIVAEASRHPTAPAGTNAAYYARETFNEVVSQAPFNKFVYA